MIITCTPSSLRLSRWRPGPPRFVFADPLGAVVLVLVQVRGQSGGVDVLAVLGRVSVAILAAGLGRALIPRDQVADDLLVMRSSRVRARSAALPGAAKRTMWYEPSRNRSIGQASRRPHGATLMIWPPPAVIWRVTRSMTAWLLSSGTSGRITSMSSRRRAGAPSTGGALPTSDEADRHGAERDEAEV